MPESLFTSQTPVNGNITDATPLHLCTRITFAVDGTITHVRWYFPTTLPSGDVKAAVYLDGGVKGSGTDVVFASPVAGAWNQVAISTPVDVTAGLTYRPSIRTPDRYVATTGASSPFALTNGNLSTITGAGRFSTTDPDGTVQFADSVFNNGCYFVDVVFVPDGEEEPETATAALTLPALTLAGSASVTATATAALTLPALTLAGAASVTATATAALTLPALTLAGLVDSGAAPAYSAAKRRQVTTSYPVRRVTSTSSGRLLDS